MYPDVTRGDYGEEGFEDLNLDPLVGRGPGETVGHSGGQVVVEKGGPCLVSTCVRAGLVTNSILFC